MIYLISRFARKNKELISGIGIAALAVIAVSYYSSEKIQSARKLVRDAELEAERAEEVKQNMILEEALSALADLQLEKEKAKSAKAPEHADLLALDPPFGTDCKCGRDDPS